MRFHGGLSTRGVKAAAGNRAKGAGWSTGKTAALAGRHLFGPPETPAVRFAGIGNGEDTEDLLARLAVLMVELGRGVDGDLANPNIPAGYTYLAQLVAHDVVHHTTSLAADNIHAPDLSGNRRLEPLVLETIYGGGPWASPQAYAVPPGRGEPRYRLRLGTIQGAPLVDPAEPLRDIPRISCPHLNDAAYDSGYRDVLIGDARNDDNLILSQLTVLFHLLHNMVVDRLRTTKDPEIQTILQDDRRQLFLIGRGVVARIYREIVRHDLLVKILDENVFQYYHPVEGPPQFLHDRVDGSVPLEFAFGVYRFGHAMVRRSYPLNDKLGRAGLTDILLQTSEARAGAMPLTADWLIQWSHFFDVQTARKPEFSRRIGPSVVGALSRTVESDRVARGGLAFEDLRSGAAAGLRTVASLLQKFANGPHNIAFDHPLYRIEDRPDSAIRTWLEERADRVADVDRRLEERHIAAIAADPPLLFFVLLEAEVIADGERLGPLGSLIVAESLLPLLERKRAQIEGDGTIEKAADSVFGQGQWPVTMPQLVMCLADNLDLARPQARFL
jgi:hypothetical protein